MSDLVVRGGKKLSGVITPDGNKNSALPIICASLLTDEDVILHNVPNIDDVQKLIETLKSIGSKIEWDIDSGDMKINNKEVSIQTDEMPVGMRGALLLFAPIVFRMKKIHFKSSIGGCSLGIREIDPHLEVMQALGANVFYDSNELEISIDNSFKGGYLWLDYMSVTTTESFIMAASVGQGKSVLMNAASEPHVQEVVDFLTSMGAQIRGKATSRLEIEGVSSLHGVEYTIGSDHHEIATFLALGAMTGGKVEVRNAVPEHFPLIVRAFKKLGIEVKYNGDTAIVEENQKLIVDTGFTSNMIPKIEAAPWPYFPVDIMPLMMALATKSKGQVMFWNKIYEGGLFWVPELLKFGVKLVMCDPHRVIIWGGENLRAATVNAPEIIRATVALFMIGASIPGESVIKNANPIKRAHPNFVEKMNSLGVDVTWND